MAGAASLDSARARVGDELDAVADEREAYERFRAEVESITPAVTRRQGSTTLGVGGVGVASTVQHTDPAGSRRRRVRRAFAETVRPHSTADVDEDESLLETVREELGAEIALALAPDADHRFTPGLKEAILTKIDERRWKLDALASALEGEARSLRSAESQVGAITDWLVDANRTPLSTLGFEDLRQRHETLAAHRRECQELVDRRQARLETTASRDGAVGLAHRSVVRYLYRELPVRYPVLATVVRLNRLLADCQRRVRDHLVRRAN